MMCAHCEARVRTALEALPGVAQAEPSHEKGSVLLALSQPVADEALARAVTNAGYEYLGKA